MSSSVATVMPEIGFDDEPISPVRREHTVTNKKPEDHDQDRAADVHVQGRRQRDGRD